MIEIIIKNHLDSKLAEPVSLEKPASSTGNYVVFEKTSSGKTIIYRQPFLHFKAMGKAYIKH